MNKTYLIETKLYEILKFHFVLILREPQYKLQTKQKY